MWFVYLLRLLKYLPLIISVGKSIYDLVQEIDKVKNVRDVVRIAKDGNLAPLKALVEQLERKQ